MNDEIKNLNRRRFLFSLAGTAVAQYGGRLVWAAQVKLDGSSVADAVRALKPGQYLWTPKIAPTGPLLMIVSIPVQRAYVYRNGILIGVSTVSTGKKGHQTPTGVFTVLQKRVHHKSNLYNSAPMPYMQRLTWSGIAMHAGHLPGYPASHGCVRMPLEFSKLIYSSTKLGMTVVVTDLDAVPRVAPTPNLLQSVTDMEGVVKGNWVWTPEKAPSGPVSLVLSGADHRLVILRNGTLIGSAPVELDGDITETTAYSLSQVDAQGYHWMQLPLPGQSWDGQRQLTAADRSRVKMADEFRNALDGELTPGATLVVTGDSLRAGATGKNLTVIESGTI